MTDKTAACQPENRRSTERTILEQACLPAAPKQPEPGARFIVISQPWQARTVTVSVSFPDGWIAADENGAVFGPDEVLLAPEAFEDTTARSCREPAGWLFNLDRPDLARMFFKGELASHVAEWSDWLDWSKAHLDWVISHLVPLCRPEFSETLRAAHERWCAASEKCARAHALLKLLSSGEAR